MEKFKKLFEAKEFRYTLNIDGPGKDGRYKSKEFEKEAQGIPGFISIRHGKPGVPSMITVQAKNLNVGYSTINDYFRDSDYTVEVSDI